MLLCSMTCIVAVVNKMTSPHTVHMAGDSLSAHSNIAQVRQDVKVFKLGEFAIGFTSSWRMGQVLHYHFTPPAFSDGADLHRYMVVDFVEALRSLFKAMAVMTLKEGVETCGTFLVGVRGRLFEIDSDFQVGESTCDYAAVGAGYHFALGAMHATRLTLMPPAMRLEYALDAAAEHSPWVRGPWHHVTA